LKENQWTGGTGTKYMLPDMKQVTVSRENGYDREALAYLYFNSDIIKDMENVVSRPNTSKAKVDSKSKFSKPLEKMRMTSMKSTTTPTGGGPSSQDADYSSIERKSVIYKVLKCL